MLAALLLSLALSGQEPTTTADPNCTDDNGDDRCASLAEDVRSLGMSSLEDERAAGTEIYRIIQVDGYGRLMPAVVYERRQGSSPQVVIHGANGAKMSAPITLGDWRRVRHMAELADRQIIRGPEDPSPDTVICAHAWLSSLEISARVMSDSIEPQIRRRTETSCYGGLTTNFAYGLTELAINNFPDCVLLDPDDYRNDMARLEQCLNFKGDRLAAVELMNQIGWSFVPENAEDKAKAWTRLFRPAAGTRLVWAGQPVNEGVGSSSAVGAFLAEFQTTHSTLRGYLGTLNAVSSTRVEVAGHLEIEGAESQGGAAMMAAFTQVWVRQSDLREWSLATWVVEPFAPVPTR